MPIFYLPPAGLDDFGTRPTARRFQTKWHDYIANGDGFRGIAGRASGNGLFYDAQDDTTPTGPPATVPWNGFPRSITQADWDRVAPLETPVIAAADEEVEVPEDGLKLAKSYSRAQ